MVLRLGGLADLDPLAVPLPPGTEVTTRVDRHHGDRVVQQGALGRVVALDGDRVEVEVVGVGRVAYLAMAAPTAKKVLYVLRTARTGMHLLRTGELVTDLTALTPLYGPAIDDLRARKQSGERAALDASEMARWQVELDRAVRDLDLAVATSMLPAEPPPAAVAALDAWLRETRRALW